MSSSKTDRPGRSRRSFIALAGVTSAAVLAGVRPALSFAQGGAAAPHLAESDPTAKALGYVEDASKVDKTKFPAFKAGAHCSCGSSGGVARAISSIGAPHAACA